MCDVTICLIAGKKVSFGKSSMVGGFKEPEQILGEMRWQIIQLVTEEEEETSSPHSGEDEKQTMKEKHVVEVHIDASARESPLAEGEELNEKETRETHSSETERLSNSARVSEIVYKRGVYLAPSKSLKDLRNAFLDSGQADTLSLYLSPISSNFSRFIFHCSPLLIASI